jgi:hypothetical protein
MRAQRILEAVMQSSRALFFRVIDQIVLPARSEPALSVQSVELDYSNGKFEGYYFYLVERVEHPAVIGPPRIVEHRIHKVVKLLALDYVPLEAREQLSILEKMRMALRGLYNTEVDFVYLVAGMFKPVYLGITQCYGVVGYAVEENGLSPAECRAAATTSADNALGTLRGMMANFEQSRLKNLTRAEVEWLSDAFAQMRFGLVGLGHPDPSRAARTLGDSKRSGVSPDEFTLEQNEMLYRGMALLQEEFLNVVMAHRVDKGQLIQLQVTTSREASRWASMERGSKGINLGVGIPLIISQAAAHITGTNYNEGQNVGIADGHSTSVAHGQSAGVAHSVSTGEAHSQGESWSTTVTQGHTTGVGSSQSVGHTDGTAATDGRSHTEGNSTATMDSVSHTSGSSWSHTEGQSSTTPNGMDIPLVGPVPDAASATVNVDVPGVGGASINLSSGTTTNSSSDSYGGMESTTTTHSSSSSHSSSDSTSHADTVSHSDSTGHSASQNESHSYSVSQGHSTSVSNTTSRSVGDTVSASESASQSEGRSNTVSRGISQSQGRTLADTSGMGIGAGLSPNISASKSYQWEDHAATLVADLIRGHERMLAEAVVEGAFITDNYFFCRTQQGQRALAGLFTQAFQGTDAVTPAQTRVMNSDEFEYLRNCAATFTPSSRRETVAGYLQTYRDAELLPPLRLATYTAIGLLEMGRATTVQERIPAFAFQPHLEGEVVVGYQVSFETGQTTEARARLSRDKMAHIGIFADTGAGKSVLALWLEYQIATQWNFREVILDFGRGHRALMNIIPPERFNLYGLDDSSPRPIRWNPLQIGRRISPQTQLDQTCQIISAAGRMGQRQYGFMWDMLRRMYLDYGVLTQDEEVLHPEAYSKIVRERPQDPISQTRVRLAQVQPSERTFLDARRARTGQAPLGNGIVYLRDLTRAELQLLAVERSKQVDIRAWYDRLEQLQSEKKAGTTDHTALEGVLHRLRPFRYGTLSRMYGSGEGSIAIEDLGAPFGVAVLEGGTLAEAQKAMILGLAAFHIYENSIQQRKETMETAAQVEEHPMLLVLEEAHKIIGGVEENAGSDSGGSSGAIISAPLWGTLARDGRKYNISYALIGQSPSHFPEEMVTSCNIFGIGTLKGDKDRKMMMSALARSTMGFEDNAYLRYISRIERARMIWKTAISMDKKDVEPILIETILLPAREPSDSEVAAHFERWGPLLENLKRNGGNSNGQA